jgi:hypothetical protein
MTTHTLPRRPTRPQRSAGPVLTPTQRPGFIAALERALQRTLQRASLKLSGTLL